MKTAFRLSRVGALILVLWTGGSAWEQSASTQIHETKSRNWLWPVIPGCLIDPDIQTLGVPDYRSPVCDVYDLLLTSGVTDLRLKSARRMNGSLAGVLYPAFIPGTEVASFIVSGKFGETFKGQNALVRVSYKSVTALHGYWWTTLGTVSEGGHLLNAEAIRAKLALSYSPACIAYAEMMTGGVRAYMGVVSPAFDEPGGGVEFWFPPDAVVAKNVADVPGGGGCLVE